MVSRIYKLFLTINLISFFSVAMVLGIAVESSWAAPLFAQSVGSPQIQIAAMDDRMQAIGKNLEGKAQEAIGNITGDPMDQAEGRAKQAEASARQMVENLKDNARLPAQVRATAKNIEGKTQEAIGNITGDPQDQISGKSKQVEAKTRNLLEDAKDKIQGFFKKAK